jgi:hypothetical protein
MPAFDPSAKRAHLITVAWMWLVTISILGAPAFGVALYKNIEESRLSLAPPNLTALSK